MTSSSTPKPSWILKDPGSFASIHVKLPSQTRVNCESDAVVSFSEGVQVRGVLTGGILGALARLFFTDESFFTTAAENTGSSVADVMMAPSDAGGIVLHRLTGSHDDDLLLTSGSYIASDSMVKVTSAMQSGIRNCLLSGTGFFLLKATGQGYVACGAYGAVHKYILRPGETRAVDNGHLVAWSSSMKYTIGLASRQGGIFVSMTSGEGLMCYFEGPGIVYLQSHKPALPKALQGKNAFPSSSNRSSMLGKLIAVTGFLLVLIVFAASWWLQIQQEDQFYKERNGRFEYAHEKRQEGRPNGSPSDRPNNMPSKDYLAQREL
jgi:uncharacterized protein (TIGR00266 family)